MGQEKAKALYNTPGPSSGITWLTIVKSWIHNGLRLDKESAAARNMLAPKWLSSCRMRITKTKPPLGTLLGTARRDDEASSNKLGHY